MSILSLHKKCLKTECHFASFSQISEVYEVRDKCFNGSAGGYKNKSKDTSPVDSTDD
ncbi:hypothetical protein DPMN_176628 [Dreissena polymorpha]|uniref:Uncharacterized protein n=1 Tax=Dreissena polymorpha TaxID=45954 RepID=A0A9D4E9G1_DREPO|nr:hypothetical protein DPMN_176628 [Dreissena polymorpha]